MLNIEDIPPVYPAFTLTEHSAMNLLQSAVDSAQEKAVKVTVSVVDSSGSQLGFVRMTGSFLVSSEMAKKKASTAAGMGVETMELERVLAEAPARVLDGLTKTEEFTVIGGGVPLYWDGILVGGIGVSGGSENEDVECARAAANAAGLAREQR